MAYSGEDRALNAWCSDNTISLKVSKTKEMIVHYRKGHEGEHATIHIKRTEAESVCRFKCITVCISSDLEWGSGENGLAASLPSVEDEIHELLSLPH